MDAFGRDKRRVGAAGDVGVSRCQLSFQLVLMSGSALRPSTMTLVDVQVGSQHEFESPNPRQKLPAKQHGHVAIASLPHGKKSPFDSVFSA